MAALDRDAIVQALFTRLQTKLAGSVKTFTRRLETYHNTPLMPALVLLSERHAAATELGAPPVWRMNVEVMIYLEAIESDDSPETRLAALVHLVEEALERTPTEPRAAWGGDYHGTSLGGLCSSCIVTGVELAQGAEAGQGEATISIVITAALP